MTTFAPESVAAALADQGFIPGAPAHVTHDAQQRDRQAASESACPCCGELGLDYIAYHKGRDYRAVACCECCGNEMEF